MCFRYYNLQCLNPNAVLKLPETPNNLDHITNEPLVGGVYLRLFISSPAWAVRKPKEFLSELMDTALNLMSKEKADVSIDDLWNMKENQKYNSNKNIYFCSWIC